MCNRWLAVVAGLACVVALLWLWQWSSPPRHNISRAAYEGIQPGMTAPEVERIIGVPPGDYCSDYTKYLLWSVPDGRKHLPWPPHTATVWLGDKAQCWEEIWVSFDAEGCVRDKGYRTKLQPQYYSASHRLQQVERQLFRRLGLW